MNNRNTLMSLFIFGLLLVGSELRADQGIDYTGSRLFGPQQVARCAKAIDQQDPRRIQVWSSDQFQLGEEDNASCGYHALRNGILLAKATIFPALFDQCCADLYSTHHIKALFGTAQSTWRSLIIQERMGAHAKSHCQSVLTSILCGRESVPDWNKAESDRVRACIPNVARTISHSGSQGGRNHRFSFSREQLSATFFAELQAIYLRGSQGNSAPPPLHTQEKMNLYLGETAFDFAFDPNQIDTGQWVSGDEFKQLIDHEKKAGMLRNLAPLIVTTYGDTVGDEELSDAVRASLDAGPGDRIEQDDHLMEGFRALKKEMRTTPHDVVGVVLVYVKPLKRHWLVQKIARFWDYLTGVPPLDAHSQLNAENTNGHWITLVVSRLKGDTRYLLADSAANHSCLRDRKINEIIEHLEGKKPQPVADTQETAAASTASLVKPITYKVATVSPALTSRPLLRSHPTGIVDSAPQQTTSAQIGMPLTTKLAYTAFAGLSLYAGYKLYKRHVAQRTDRNTNSQTAPQAAVQENFLI